MTPTYFSLLKKAGYLGKPNQTFSSEIAVAMMLATEKTEKTLCSIEAVEKIYTGGKRLEEVLELGGVLGDVDYIMVGTNGVEENDKVYFENCEKLFPGVPLLQYKKIFGEGYTTPALGVYAAAICLQRGDVPKHLRCEVSDVRSEKNKVNKILCYNHFEEKNHTFILLSRES